MTLSYVYTSEALRKAFFKYVQSIHPTCSDRTIQTYVSNAMFIVNALSEASLSKILSSEIWTDEIESYMMNTVYGDILAMRKYPVKDTKDHVRDFKMFHTFMQMVKILEQSRLEKPRDIRMTMHGNT